LLKFKHIFRPRYRPQDKSTVHGHPRSITNIRVDTRLLRQIREILVHIVKKSVQKGLKYVKESGQRLLDIQYLILNIRRKQFLLFFSE